MHFLNKDLSDQPHFKGADEGAEHNPEYDHEAFLGREEAKTFDDLTPEESKERLGFVDFCLLNNMLEDALSKLFVLHQSVVPWNSCIRVFLS